MINCELYIRKISTKQNQGVNSISKLKKYYAQYTHKNISGIIRISVFFYDDFRWRSVVNCGWMAFAESACNILMKTILRELSPLQYTVNKYNVQ